MRTAVRGTGLFSAMLNMLLGRRAAVVPIEAVTRPVPGPIAFRRSVFFASPSPYIQGLMETRVSWRWTRRAPHQGPRQRQRYAYQAFAGMVLRHSDPAR